jgi:AraC-like DNA-binding protein
VTVQYLQKYNLLSTPELRGPVDPLAGILPRRDFTIPQRQPDSWIQFNYARLSIGALFFSRWVPGMSVCVPRLDGYYVAFLLDGIEEFRSPGTHGRWRPGHGFILGPDSYMNRTAETECTHLTLRIDPAPLEQRLYALAGRSFVEPLEFEPVIDPHTSSGASIKRTLQFVATQLDKLERRSSSKRLVCDLENLLVNTLLLCQPSNHSKYIHCAPDDLGPKYVRVAEEYIDAHCAERITLATLSRVTRVGVRALNAAFRKYRATTPIQYLKSVRLKNVRRDLLEADPTARVTEVAAAWGFYQLGWFSGEYKRTFGESPSETLHRRGTRH